jgi:hypothetical protein
MRVYPVLTFIIVVAGLSLSLMRSARIVQQYERGLVSGSDIVRAALPTPRGSRGHRSTRQRGFPRR